MKKLFFLLLPCAISLFLVLHLITKQTKRNVNDNERFKVIVNFKRIISLLIITMFIGNFTSCNNKEETTNIKLTSGIYTGYFDYQGTKYWCEIDFDNYNYYEFPSGGVAYQKSLSCLSIGKYKTLGNKIIFTLDSIKYPTYFEPCVPDMFLPGEYTIHNTNKIDSIFFERGKDSNNIKYYLKRTDN
jgi:hypothetical protein